MTCCNYFEGHLFWWIPFLYQMGSSWGVVLENFPHGIIWSALLRMNVEMGIIHAKKNPKSVWMRSKASDVTVHQVTNWMRSESKYSSGAVSGPFYDIPLCHDLIICFQFRRGKDDDRCIPVCPQGCVYGRCTAPNTCTCNFGYVGTDCSLHCQCNGHSECEGPDQLSKCLHCHNNTMVSHMLYACSIAMNALCTIGMVLDERRHHWSNHDKGKVTLVVNTCL